MRCGEERMEKGVCGEGIPVFCACSFPRNWFIYPVERRLVWGSNFAPFDQPCMGGDVCCCHRVLLFDQCFG